MQALERARESLDGLSVGDAFGECFIHMPPSAVISTVQQRAVPPAPWPYTDDTEMALTLYASLRLRAGIEVDWIAQSFAENQDLDRGYGRGMWLLLSAIRHGYPWRHAAPSLFEGNGSYGNGAAMRVAPVGAYFADDLDLVIEQAHYSAEVTHCHPEGIAGALAIALAAAWACRDRQAGEFARGPAFLERIWPLLPPSQVREGIRRAQDVAPDQMPILAAKALGNGSHITAQDTVPFVLWCAAGSPDDYPAALWRTVSGFGDIDTNCAMVGGIVACATGCAGIPSAWLAAREPLPHWSLAE